MTTATAIASAAKGDVLTLDGETFMLWPACGATAPMLACVPCGTLLANIGQAEMHLETPGDHRLAARCTKHGWEAFA